MSKGTILVVDDDAAVRKALKLRLEAVDYNVIDASSGEQALNRAATQKPDMMLLDLNMARGDGFAVMASLDANPELSKIPVIVISGQNDANTKARVKEAGAFIMLEKPLAKQDLLGAIRRAMRSSPRWPGRLLQQLVFKYERQDLIRAEMLTLAHGEVSPQLLIRNLSLLYFSGAVAMLVLLSSTTGFAWCILFGITFLCCPTLILSGVAAIRVALRIKDDPSWLNTPMRIRAFLDTGLAFDHASQALSIPWEQLEGYEMDETTILIYARKTLVAIPRRLFDSEDAEQEFLSDIRENSIPYVRRESGTVLRWEPKKSTA